MMASLFTFQNLHGAWLDCRRRKRNKPAALAFEVRAEENLLDLARELSERTYSPRPSFCFVAKNDKHREVFAADFRDRVVHHLLVRELEKIWEPVFIHDSYACRRGKGTHTAVERLRLFMRQVTANGTRRAWFAQLDIRAFFPSIDRRILLNALLARLDNEELRWLSTVLVMHDPARDPRFTCSRGKWRNVPLHKSLFGVSPGKGLPIGNLTSQFFANVYLNALDQFVKHTLKARYYVRYVDDLVLLYQDRHLLFEWIREIEGYLESALELELHPHRRCVRPISNGVDFLGYIVRPSHLFVRNRVVRRCKDALAEQTRAMTTASGDTVVFSFPFARYDKLHATLASYLGAFDHASCFRLTQSIMSRFPVLRFLFAFRNRRLAKHWAMPSRPSNLRAQYRHVRSRFSGIIAIQVGCHMEFFDRDAVWAEKALGLRRIQPRRGFYARCGFHAARRADIERKIMAISRSVLFVGQTHRSCGSLVERTPFRAIICVIGAGRE